MLYKFSNVSIMYMYYFYIQKIIFKKTKYLLWSSAQNITFQIKIIIVICRHLGKYLYIKMLSEKYNEKFGTCCDGSCIKIGRHWSKITIKLKYLCYGG